MKGQVYMACIRSSVLYECEQNWSRRSEDQVERGSSAVECRTRNQVSPLLPFRRLGIFVLSIGAPVETAVQMSTWLETVVDM